MTLIDAKHLIHDIIIIPLSNIDCGIQSLEYNKMLIYLNQTNRFFTVYVTRPIPFINTFIVEFYVGLQFSRRRINPAEKIKLKINSFNEITILNSTNNIPPTPKKVIPNSNNPLMPKIKLNLK